MPRYELVLRTTASDEVTLDNLAACTGMHPALIARLVEFGLIRPIATRGDILFFEYSKIPRLRSIKRLRSDLGINLPGVAVVLDLLDRVHDLERENASLRAQL